jgi:heat shock protein HslJ
VKLFAYFPVVVLILAATVMAQNTSDLAGTSWQLVRFVGGDNATLTPDDSSKYTLAFQADGTANVRIDCNRGRSAWKSETAHQLEFGPLALTRAMCPEAPLTTRLPNDWEYIRSYVIKDEHLYLSLIADGGTYEFEPAIDKQAAEASPALEGTDWRLTNLGDTSITANSPQQVAHFTLDAKTHRVSGSSGCNRMMGGYSLEGDNLSFTQMAGTMMACPQGMDTEQAFLKALGSVKKWKIEGQQLELFDLDGKLLARLAASKAE